MFKDSAFEPSSTVHHGTELCNILLGHSPEKPILFVYTDGGPNHQVTYTLGKFSLIWATYIRMCYENCTLPVVQKSGQKNNGYCKYWALSHFYPKEIEAAAKALRAVAS